MNAVTKSAWVLVIFSMIISCQSAKQTPFELISPIAGVWSMPVGDKPEDGFIIESWIKVNDTLYSGRSYKVIDGDSTLTETIQLILKGTDLFYIPTVQAQNNQQPVSFRLTRQEGMKFTFENPEHDFPTTIVYEFRNDSTLKASISGTINSELKTMDFEYTRK